MSFFTWINSKLFSRSFLVKACLVLLVLFTLFLGFSFSSYYLVTRTAADRIYVSVEKIPSNDVAVVLGTAEKSRKGGFNPYFSTRMEAAAALYHHGKVKHILVSGDNKTMNYNEPVAMRKYLIMLGVPKSAITLDYAGFRTFDSMVRAREVFGQDKFTIVSQGFHNERALFICHALGIEAVAYNAAEVKSSRTKMYVRELLARSKAVLDIYVLRTKPRFLGKKERLNTMN